MITNNSDDELQKKIAYFCEENNQAALLDLVRQAQKDAVKAEHKRRRASKLRLLKAEDKRVGKILDFQALQSKPTYADSGNEAERIL